jgi:uncharacterized protein YbbC (DUF1343 family)
LAHVKTGLDRLLADDMASLRGKRTGLLVHPASVDGQLRPTVDLLHGSSQVNLVALFGPQHGISGQTQDNMIEWEGFRDPITSAPVYSLYGKHRKPTPEMLAGLDILVIDLQDVGARYYTFIWTMLLCLEACAEAGVQVLVLDRPNPLGGVATEGNILDTEFRSFVGLAPIPMRHGLTIGEVAKYFVAWAGLDVDLKISWMDGWNRTMDFADTGLPWVLPSPNMPTLDTAFVYPGGCLLEGTELSEGRGTTRPFELFGAPYVDPLVLVAELRSLNLPGVHWRPVNFEPTFHKFANQVCGGVQVHVIDRKQFSSVLAYTAAITAINKLYPEKFSWKKPPYEYEHDKRPIDILAGGEAWARDVCAGRPVLAMQSDWEQPLKDFAEATARFRHYE